LADGTYNLVVVNHRSRESLEIFLLVQDGLVPRVVWKGCIVLPPPASGNSVAALPNNAGYIATNFLQRSDPHFLQEMENGTPTGNVLKWTPQNGWSEFTPQRFSGPNGVEVTADGKWLFINEWSDYKIWRYPLEGGEPPATIYLDFLPDNLRRTDKGSIFSRWPKCRPG
jgi:sugar lactone lactonase YvrE